MTTRARSRKLRFARPRQISRTKRTCISHTLPCARISARSGESEAQGRQSPEWDSGCGPCYLKGNKALLWLDTVVPSVPQVPLWHDFTDRMCFCKRMLVCPANYCKPGEPGADFRGRGRMWRPPTERARPGWLGWAGLGGQGWLGLQRGRLQRAEIFRALRPRPASCGAAAKHHLPRGIVRHVRGGNPRDRGQDPELVTTSAWAACAT